MTKNGKPKVTGLYHVGMYTRNPVALAEFYQEVLGLQIVGRSDSPDFQAAFLSSRPNEESHQIALFAKPESAHIAFKVDTLADLRAFYQHIVARGLPIKMTSNHGVSLAFYFHDPEENMIEVYWPTGLAYGQPYGHPIDLTTSEEALRQDVAELAGRVGAIWP